jgi:hypothetical protein
LSRLFRLQGRFICNGIDPATASKRLTAINRYFVVANGIFFKALEGIAINQSLFLLADPG